MGRAEESWEVNGNSLPAVRLAGGGGGGGGGWEGEGGGEGRRLVLLTWHISPE